MFIENKNKEKKKLTLGRIAAAPFIGTARLFTAPFVLPPRIYGYLQLTRATLIAASINDNFSA